MMWPYYYDGWTGLWLLGMMMVFWGTVILLAAWVIRSNGSLQRKRCNGDSAQASGCGRDQSGRVREYQAAAPGLTI